MVIINSFRYPESNIRHEQRDVRAILDKQDLGLGTLFVSESTLCWQEKDNIGFSIGYPDITLHAISKDQSVYPRECLFIVVDGKITMPGDEERNDINEDSDSSGDEQDNEVSELLLVPPEEDVNAVKNIYEALKICQELNPDPEDMEDDDDNLYADAEDIEEEEEGHYHVNERGAGDADIEDISRRMEENAVTINYANSNGNNDDDEFEDAD